MLHSPIQKKNRKPRPISKNLCKVTNPVISILPSSPWPRSKPSYIENYNRPIRQPCMLNDMSGSIPNDKCSQNVLSKSTNIFHSNKGPGRPPTFIKCLNPLVSIPPMTIEVQSNINIYPKRRPEKGALAAKTIYEYKFPYTSSEEDWENTEVLTNYIGISQASNDSERNKIFFESKPILNDDVNDAASRISEEQCSKMDSNLKSQPKYRPNWAFDQDSATDCEDNDIKQMFNIKPMQCNSENDFMLNIFSSRLEERLRIFLDNATFMPSSTIKEEPKNTNAPICELPQSCETAPEKDAVSNIEVQKIMPQPFIISKGNEHTKNKTKLFSSSSLEVDDEVEFFNKSSQTEPFSEVEYYRNKGVSLDNMLISNENINSCNEAKSNIVINACNGANGNIDEFKLDSIVSSSTNQMVTKENASVCLNETFDIDQICESQPCDRNFVDPFTSLNKVKSGLASFSAPSQQLFHNSDELPLISFPENTYLPHNETCTQNINCISKPNSVEFESPVIDSLGKNVCNSSRENAIISCQKLVEIKDNECTLHKISEEMKTIKINDCDNNKGTFFDEAQVNQPALNKFSDYSLGIVSPNPYENVNKINSHSEIILDKTDDLTLPSSSEILYSEVHQSYNEFSTGELCQPTNEIEDLTISEGELGFEASLTSDMFPFRHITIKVTPKDSSLLESLPSFSLDFKSLKYVQVAKETQTEFPNGNKFLTNREDDSRISWTNTDVNETVSSGEVIQDSDQMLHCGRLPEMGNLQKENIRLRKQEMEMLQKENIKLRNKLSCYSGRFLRDP